MKKIISLLLIAIMLLSTLPIVALAQDVQPEPKLSVDNVCAKPGKTVDVYVDIENNPGITSANLTFTFDSELTLVGATSGDAFEALSYMPPNKLSNGGKISSSCKFAWFAADIAEEDIKDGTVVILTFEVSESAEVGKTYKISVSSDEGDVLDKDLNPYILSAEAKAFVIDYTPGDTNEDGNVNMLDVVMACRYIVDGCRYDPEGYAVLVNEKAANVNDDARINMLDVVLLCRYIVDGCIYDPEGYAVKLLPVSVLCNHSMIEFEAQEETCTEDGNTAYWFCENCEKYFSDADGETEISFEDTVIEADHKIVVDEGKAPTHEETGLTEGTHCDRCKEVLTAQEIIPIIPYEYSIEYKLYDSSDDYLLKQTIENNKDNPSGYDSVDGTDLLKDPTEPAGYQFMGWYDAPKSNSDATRYTSIPTGSKGNYQLYAHWKKVEYTIHFDSPDVPVEDETYTVDTGKVLNPPKMYGYTFVGWSNDDGFIISRINPGTTGNMTLHANWTSNRNKATSYGTYASPTIIEDDKNGQFLFVYDIGRIDNVPLYPYIDAATGSPIGANNLALDIDMEYTVKEDFSEKNSEEIIRTVADATTRSSGWTLSKEWNDLYSEEVQDSTKQVKSEERTDTQGNVVGGNYFVSNSQGGSSFVSTESGGSSSNSSKVTTDESYGINTSYDTSTETYCDAKLGVENKTEVSAGVEIPVKIAKVSAGVKNTTTVSAEVSSGRKDNEAFHVDDSYSSYVGTVTNNASSSYYNTVANQSSNWNSTSGYEKSYETSSETSVSQAVKNEIAKTTTHNITKALGGSDETTQTISGVTSSENGYSNSLSVEKYYSSETTKHIKYKNSDVGYYRVVKAGTVHVYGVVGYDVATASYYTYTFNVLADDTFEYVDFSKERATFDDCENGVVTFNIPYEVNEYILGVTSETEGLEIGLDGKVNNFETPENFKGTVAIPQYHADTQPGTDNVAIKVNAINSEAFRGNTDIETVILPTYITEIPDNAFEGCTNLKTVIAYGVTKIGANAFKDCTSLESFSIDNCVTELGENAFENVPELKVMAYDSAVADAAIASGAKKITVNISKIKDSYDNKKVVVSNDTDYFAIIGNDGVYNNLQIDSSAKETVVSRIKFVNNTDTPLKINSPKLTLSVVTVENSPVYSMILGAENIDLKLYGEISLSTKEKNAVISKNVVLSKANNNITSKLILDGDYLVCGEVTNKETFLNVEPISISSDEYDVYVSPVVVEFNPNSGEVNKEYRIVYKTQEYGELPTPEKQYYEFEGWYTEVEGGELITATSIVPNEEGLANQILYAHWKALTSKIIFDANEGVIDATDKLVYIGEPAGELPVPTRDYYTFDGWYTETEEGTEVTAETIMTSTEDITLHAHWVLNELSDWVLPSEVPEDAEVVENKWTYKTRTTSNSATAPEGYSQYQDPTWVWGAYGNWSAWSDSAVSKSDSRDVQTQSVAASYRTAYNYFRYSYGAKEAVGSVSYSYQPGSASYYTYKSYTEMPWKTSAQTGGAAGYGWTVGNSWILVWAAPTYKTQEVASYKTQYRYRDRSKVYTYYYETIDDLESETEITESDTISNVQAWVKYRAK